MLQRYLCKLQDQMSAIGNNKIEMEPQVRPRYSHFASIHEETSSFLKDQIQKQKFRSNTRKSLQK